ncbi:MAG: NifB/NifX family molybdenum-iron cluster-binding protein [Victivallaceae bacterium]|nr:NifB/NifX family molybdenum-iron cluster-binding protein [Victivallaceae bacterium]
MPRPFKPRIVCRAQERRCFETSGSLPPIELAPDELEAIRLADLKELEQSEAARRMAVSRGTLQRLLYSARRKTAFALTTGRSIMSGGGDNPVTPGCDFARKCRFCPNKLNPINHKENATMKIAVTSENGQVFQHFGHTPEFSVFEITDGMISGMTVEPTGDSGHGALAGFLAERKVDLLICGGIGGGAQMALAEAGVQLVAGVSGDVTEAVGNYLKGTLQADPDFLCHHHDHEAGHSCGEHGCGSHGCKH